MLLLFHWVLQHPDIVDWKDQNQTSQLFLSLLPDHSMVASYDVGSLRSTVHSMDYSVYAGVLMLNYIYYKIICLIPEQTCCYELFHSSKFELLNDVNEILKFSDCCVQEGHFQNEIVFTIFIPGCF